MEVILLQDIRSVGTRGETIKVKPGFARNYLLPQGMALEATTGNRAFFEQQRKKIDARHTKERNDALEVAAQLAEVKITIAKRVGEHDTLYGSVTAADIIERLAEKGIEVDRRRLDLGETPTLKTVGDHKVAIDLHPDVVAEVTVSIVPEV